MRRKRFLVAAALTVATAAVTAGPAHALTPVDGGDAGGTAITVNDGAGEQSEPHIGGSLVVYTERVGIFSPGTIRYSNLSTGSHGVVPGGAPGDSDALADVNAGRIAFSRTRAADSTTAAMIFDVASGVVTELDPQPGEMRFGMVVGGDTVAYAEFALAQAEVFAYDLAAGTATNLSQSPDLDMHPAVSPGGDVVVWERCVGSNCDIYGSRRVSGTWSAPALVAATAANEADADSDGTTVVYHSTRLSPTGLDVYLTPVSGGSEIALELPGLQRNPHISAGVVSFESKTAPETPADLYVYVLATNTVFRVTDTPAVDETLNDVTVLPSGEVRMVWAADDDAEAGLHNVYARTLTLPLTADSDPPTLVLPAGITVDATSPAGANVSFLVTATDGTDPSPVVSCTPSSGSPFAIGATTVACTATDYVGNTATGSFTVTVRGAKDQLTRLIADVVAASGLPPAVKAQLLARIQPLLAGFDPTNAAQRRAACTGLSLFIAALRLLSGHGVPPAPAAAWIADASRIRAVLGC